MGEIRLAVRSLLRSKLFTAVAIFTLAIGIGASTAVFSVFNAVALRPLPFDRPDRLVDIEEWSATELCGGCGVGVSAPMVVDIERRATSLQAVVLYSEYGVNVGGREAPERVSAAAVSGNFFGVLGVHAVRGRAIDPTDAQPGAPKVAVIGERFHRRRFAGDPAVVGQTIRLDGTPTTIVGVMPATAVLPDFAEIWVPLDRTSLGVDRGSRDVGVIGRLKDGVSRAAADTELRTIAADLEAAFPETQKNWTARARSLRDAVGDDSRSVFGIMLAAVFALWAVVCANLAALLLARGFARRKEMAVRLALGANRRTIVWHLFAESLVLAVAGGALGALAASWVIEGILLSLDSAMPSWLTPRLDASVLGFCVFLSLVSASAFGLLPAVRASRADVHEDLKSGTPASIRIGRSRLRGSLVVLQLSLSLMLLAVAGVFSSTIASRSDRNDARDDDIVQARVELPADLSPEQRAGVVAALVERFGALAEARTAGASADGFLAGFGSAPRQIRVEGLPILPEGASPRFYHAVTPDFFITTRKMIVEGRAFNAADRRGANPVAIINARLARRLWPDRPAVGRRIKLGADSMPWRTIVGVVGDPHETEDRPAGSSAYVPFAQSPLERVTFYVSAKAAPAGIIRPMREAAREVAPDLPLLDHMTTAQAHAMAWRPLRAYAVTISGIGIVALVLAAVGLYGIVAYGAELRTREIGVRIALGAKRSDVIGLVTRQGMTVVGFGVALGLAGAAAVAPIMRGLLFGASPINAPVFAGSAILLVVVAALASYVPARRAAATDPMVALRAD